MASINSNKFFRWMGRLRIEEIIALLFFIPSLIITIHANLYFQGTGLVIPRRFYGGIIRLAVTLSLMTIYFVLLQLHEHKTYLRRLRTIMPFLFCISIYTNLHDTIGFINANDVHFQLIAIDKFLFGVEPVLWVQQYYQPWLTDYFSLSYMNYFYIVVAVVVFLMIKKDEKRMRTVLLGTIFTFYIGYFLYIIFPAAPPRLVLADQFSRTFTGGWLTAAQNKLININPSSSRAAFPSLHCAVTLISLIYAFKNSKILFWILLIPGVSLVLATVYLRHHYVVDILAGFALAIFAYFIAPLLDKWWDKLRARMV